MVDESPGSSRENQVGTCTQLWTPIAAIQELATNSKLLQKNYTNTINIVCFNILCMHVFLLACQSILLDTFEMESEDLNSFWVSL